MDEKDSIFTTHILSNINSALMEILHGEPTKIDKRLRIEIDVFMTLAQEYRIMFKDKVK